MIANICLVNVYYRDANFTWEANNAADVWLWLRLEVGEDEDCCCPPTPLVFPMFPDEVLIEYDDGLLTVDVWCKLDPMAACTAAWLEYAAPAADDGQEPGGEPDAAEAAAAADNAAEFEKWSI